jgi:hypothetical protein
MWTRSFWSTAAPTSCYAVTSRGWVPGRGHRQPRGGGRLDEPIKLVTCLGFGIDAYHGVNHVQVLENLAALDRDGGYLGALSIPSGSREAARQIEAQIGQFHSGVDRRIPRIFPH